MSSILAQRGREVKGQPVGFKNCNPYATIGPILYRKDRW